MPQLDFSTYTSQIFWLAITFIILYAFIQTYVAPAIESLISIRKNKIEQDLAHATEIRTKVEELRAKYQENRQAVSSKISEMLERELAALNKKMEEENAKVNNRILEKTSQIEAKITEQTQKYKAELDKAIVEFAIFLIHKISNLSASKQELNKYRN